MKRDMEKEVFPRYQKEHPETYDTLRYYWDLSAEHIPYYFSYWPDPRNDIRKGARRLRGGFVKIFLLHDFSKPVINQFARDVYSILERHIFHFMEANMPKSKHQLNDINEEARLSDDPIEWSMVGFNHYRSTISKSMVNSLVHTSPPLSTAATSQKIPVQKTKAPPDTHRSPANALLAPNKNPSVQRDPLRADSPPRSPRLRVRSPSSRKRP